MPVRAVIFDLGNVLISVCWQHALARVAGHTPLPLPAVLERVTEAPLLRDYEEGRVDSDAFCAGMVALLELDLCPSAYAEAWCSVFERRRRMERLFAAVQTAVPVAILSDTSPLHWEGIAAEVPLFAAAPVLGLSYEIGSHKPDRRNYEAVLSALGEAPEACLFVDDRAENVAGAEAVGIPAFQFTDEASVEKRIREAVFGA